MVVIDKPILYICPYCSKGRFTAEDGWAGAVRHIREKHRGGKDQAPRSRYKKSSAKLQKKAEE